MGQVSCLIGQIEERTLKGEIHSREGLEILLHIAVEYCEALLAMKSVIGLRLAAGL